jgi:hypothetical protein
MVSIITINYNNARLTCDMLASLQKLQIPGLEVIVVRRVVSLSERITKRCMGKSPPGGLTEFTTIGHISPAFRKQRAPEPLFFVFSAFE